jgi:hypothetical protein
MNSERSQAYGRVMKTLADLGPAKLHADEQELIREAADALFFCEDESARDAFTRVDELAGRLVESERLLAETADQLLADLEGCGPAARIA